jgi:plasmid stabilization system protein ParE
MRYEFHPEALEEYREAAGWYGNREPGLAVRFVGEVEDAIRRILDASRSLASRRRRHSSLSDSRFPMRYSLHH